MVSFMKFLRFFVLISTSVLLTSCSGVSSDFYKKMADVQLNGLHLNTDSILVIVGNSKLLTITASPESAATKGIVWDSSDDTVASVDSDGRITGVSPGEVSVSASTSDGLYSDVCTVTVRNGFVLNGVVDVAEITPPHTGEPLTFPTTASETPTLLPSPYIVAESDVTYELWETVQTWAVSSGLGYNFSGIYALNGSDISGDGFPVSDSASKQYPVTNVSWNQAIVWCNAFTEYSNATLGTYLTCVYQVASNPVRDWNDPSISSVSTNTANNGFRLPSLIEYEYAARYQGTTFSSNTIAGGGIGPVVLYYTKYNSASGATDGYTNNAATSEVAVFGIYYGGSDTGVTGTAKVKSKKPNFLGLYDMSGNVGKWCEQYDSVTVYYAGGDFAGNSADCQIGSSSSFTTMKTLLSNRIGFRYVRTL